MRPRTKELLRRSILSMKVEVDDLEKRLHTFEYQVENTRKALDEARTHLQNYEDDYSASVKFVEQLRESVGE